MSRKTWAWIVVLICSHLLAFFASRPGGSELEGVLESRNGGAMAEGASSKSRVRGVQDGANTYRRLLDELDASDLKGDDYKDARAALMIDWIRKDLRGAMAHFYSPSNFARYRSAFRDWDRGVFPVLTEEMARQPMQCWDWIFSDSYGSNRGKLVSLWVHSMRMEGLRDALLDRAAEGEKFMEDALSEECGRMNEEELQQLRELWDRGLYQGLGDEYVARRLALAGGDLRDVYDQEQDAKLKEAMLPQWASQEIGLLPMKEALDRLGEVPEELLPEAVRLVSYALSEGDSEAGMEGAVKLVEEMERRDLWRHVPERETEHFLTQLLSYDASKADPGVLVEQLGSIRRDEFREIALREVGRRWGDYSDPKLVLKSVETLPSGVDRDRFISGVLERTYEQEVFDELKEEIEDPRIKEKAPKKPSSGEGG